MGNMNDYLKSSRPMSRRSTIQPSEIVIRLQGQLNIEAGLVNQN